MDGETILLMPADSLPLGAAVYRWGIALIQAIQSAEGPALTALMKAVTFMGTEAFLIPLGLLIFWCVDERRGFTLAMLVIFSAWANASLKILFKQPRPYQLEPLVGRAFESSYGFPSGHAQVSVCFWLPLAVCAGERWKRARVGFLAGAALLILLIGLSRLYLGVHFPTDLLGGWVAGGLLLAAWRFLGPWLEKTLGAAGERAALVTTALAALVMNGLLRSEPGLSALFLGFGCGYVIMIRRFPFSAAGPPRGRKPALGLLAARYAFGIGTTALIFTVLRLILPGEESLLKDLPGWGPASYNLGRFIRYGLLGCWVSLGAPWLFLRLGLAAPGDSPRNRSVEAAS